MVKSENVVVEKKHKAINSIIDETSVNRKGNLCLLMQNCHISSSWNIILLNCENELNTLINETTFWQ